MHLALDWTGVRGLSSQCNNHGSLRDHHDPGTSEIGEGKTSSLSRLGEDDLCSSAPSGSNLMLSLKMGASRMHYLLPTHLLTLVRCAPANQLLISSDRDEIFAGYPVHDVLKNVSRGWKEMHDDFETYRMLEKYRTGGLRLETLYGTSGWLLDKWKYIPIALLAHALAPSHVEWFVFLEDDAAVSWTNLIAWLATLDPSEPRYIGRVFPVINSTLTFAHGGSGYVMSRPALERLVHARETEGAEAFDQRWENYTSTSCCGDIVTGAVMEEAGVVVEKSGGVLQMETLNTITFTNETWCQTPATQHHVDAYQINDLWRFQTAWVRKHGWTVPYTWSDLFRELVLENIQSPRKEWYNWREDMQYFASANESVWDSYDDVQKASVESAENCAEACDHEVECLQWRWIDGRCFLGTELVYGIASEQGAEFWTSGWHLERVERRMGEWGDCRGGRGDGR
ncbi:hypothetical protein BDZ85DRAFT_192667 [Elsinoe ampelina]|uniref:N-acetylgalactosaminide beta-1,3-galactosyltransferase n=1 Tax=Elsinoe ampelina TaxID=302913 RepID=A0A6A6GK51_9PEZI|nr:hypothetical protein BDZ85DRAFT_192667 [Elsinoe ampelina]